jgi:acyl-CoA reductase-like NAD-dependent aldehyde dehydrogenase
VQATQAMKVGLPDDPAAMLGPLISHEQRARVEGFVEKGKAAGATAVLDGGRPDGYANDPCAPFGGYKQSGIGRQNGPEGLESYLEHKSVMLPLG